MKASAQLTPSFHSSQNPSPQNDAHPAHTHTSKVSLLPQLTQSGNSQTFPEACQVDNIHHHGVINGNLLFKEEGAMCQRESPELVQTWKVASVCLCRVLVPTNQATGKGCCRPLATPFVKGIVKHGPCRVC